ncbi:MAG TPA: hypothetical protein VMW18_00490 [Candidatus Binatia bacterium]|nr:hypothetical protein [Candidatus Binatia bacterium]
MSEEKEVQRLMGIAKAHAAATLAKPEIQRESHLAFCRLQWKRYAAGISRNPRECERFADALSQATRDLMTAIEENEAAIANGAAPEPPTGSAGSSVEDDIIWAHDFGYDLATLKAAIAEAEAEAARAEAARIEAAKAQAERTRAAFAAQGGEAGPLPPAPADLAEAQAAESEDRTGARYGFGRAYDEAAKPAAPQADPEVQRRIRDVLRAHAVKKDDEEKSDG